MYFGMGVDTCCSQESEMLCYKHALFGLYFADRKFGGGQQKQQQQQEKHITAATDGVSVFESRPWCPWTGLLLWKVRMTEMYVRPLTAADFAAGLGRLRRPAPPNSRIESEDNLVTLAPSLSHKYDVARSRTREIQTIYCSTAGSFFNLNFIMRPLFRREENHIF